MEKLAFYRVFWRNASDPRIDDTGQNRLRISESMDSNCSLRDAILFGQHLIRSVTSDD